MLIDFKNIQICIGNNTILRNVDFKVDENEFVYIVGRVGSGKSSLLRAISAENAVHEGEAKVLEHDLRKLRRKNIPQLRREIGIVFQDFRLLPHLSVAQNLDFVLRATDWKKAARQQRIAEVLEQVGMADKARHYPHELSGGEQQHIAIARALLNHPKIVLADEPTGHLDIETGQHIVQLLRSLTQQGTAVVMVTHNLHYLSEHPGVVYRCEGGTISEATHDFTVLA